MSWQDGVTKYVLVNVLEEVVMKEAEFQHSQLPPAMQDKVAVIDIGAYVLNRIPPMYASNKQGWGFQREKALRRAHLEIAPKVKEAIQYLQRAPMRMSAPLPAVLQAENALNQVRAILNRQELTWAQVPGLVQQLLLKLQEAQHRAPR